MKETKANSFETTHFDNTYEDLFSDQPIVTESSALLDNSSKFGEIDNIGDDIGTPIIIPVKETKSSNSNNTSLEMQINELREGQQSLQQRVDEIENQKEVIAQRDKMEQLDLLSKERQDRKQLQELVGKGNKKTTCWPTLPQVLVYCRYYSVVVW